MPKRSIATGRVLAATSRLLKGVQSYAIDRQAVDPYDNYLVYDTFVDDDGKALASHVPNKDDVGGGWVGIAGTPTIDNNTVIGGGLSRFRIDCGDQDQILEVQARAQGGFLRCELRWTDADWKLGVLIRDDVDQVAVYRYAGAGAVSIGGGAYVFTPGVFYSLFIRYGSNGFVYVEVNGTLICDIDEGNQVGTGTNVHFEMPNQSPPWALDNLGIRAAP